MISFLVETHALLPAHHFGGRPGRTTEDAMTLLTENIHQAWKTGEIYSAVFMDVAGAFNNVHHERLIHNLRKRKVPEKIAKWIRNFLKDRTTKLRFNNATSQSISTPAGVPQGSPLSPLLYIFYNADLLDIPENQEELGLGFIDDIGYGTSGLMAESNVEKLQQLLQKAEIWRRQHGAQFERSKYVLIHFTGNGKLKTEAPIEIDGVTIHPAEEAKYLGVTFDKKLKYRAHIEQVVKKGTKFALAIGNIAKSTWGAEFKYLRRLFTAVAAPRMDYAASIWHRPGDTRTAPTTSQLNKMASVQRQIMRTITGCFRTTPTAALEAETALPPPQFRLRNKILRSVTRMRTLPANHPVQQCIKRAKSKGTPAYLSNLENIIKQFPEYMQDTMEEIHPYIRPPWWTLEAEIHIDGSKDEAEKHHNRAGSNAMNDSTILIYTDGSGINGNIGAAAYCSSTGQKEHQYLGKDKTHNVYAAELEAINMATNIVKESDRKYTKCVIYANS